MMSCCEFLEREEPRSSRGEASGSRESSRQKKTMKRLEFVCLSTLPLNAGSQKGARRLDKFNRNRTSVCQRLGRALDGPKNLNFPFTDIISLPTTDIRHRLHVLEFMCSLLSHACMHDACNSMRCSIQFT
jgi:hypothetical protein